MENETTETGCLQKPFKEADLVKQNPSKLDRHLRSERFSELQSWIASPNVSHMLQYLLSMFTVLLSFIVFWGFRWVICYVHTFQTKKCMIPRTEKKEVGFSGMNTLKIRMFLGPQIPTVNLSQNTRCLVFLEMKTSVKFCFLKSSNKLWKRTFRNY